MYAIGSENVEVVQMFAPLGVFPGTDRRQAFTG